MQNNIISMTVQTGTEPCNVDIAVMHQSLLQLPAEKYLELYHMMKNKVENRIYSLPEFAEGGTFKGSIGLL